MSIQSSTTLHPIYRWQCTVEQAYKKCSVCLGPSKVMGKIFCHMCMMKHTSQVHTWREVPMTRWVQARGHFDALWCNLHLYLNLFCVNIIFFNFLLLNIFCGVNFFLGPAVPWSCGFCRPAVPGGFTRHMTGYAPACIKSVEKGSFFRHTAASTSFAKRVYFWLLIAI